MANVSKTRCIETNDYESAIDRFNNTTKQWSNYWWDCIEQIYNNCKEFANKYILDTVNHIVKKIEEATAKIRKSRRSKYDDIITNFTDWDIADKDGIEKCYLFKFFDNDNNLLYSKVGTTAKNSIRGRLIDEIRSYRKNGYDVARAEIDRVWNCGDFPAEGLESLIRSEYIKQYPHSFKKNDRFINTLFDLDLCDSIANEYLAVVG